MHGFGVAATANGFRAWLLNIIDNARIQTEGKYESCMASKLRIGDSKNDQRRLTRPDGALAAVEGVFRNAIAVAQAVLGQPIAVQTDLTV